MISKELFCKTIADVQEQNRKISEFNHSKNRNCIRRNAGPQWQYGLCLRRYILLDAGGKSHW